MDDSVLKDRALALWMHGQNHHLRGDLESAIALYTRSLAFYPTAEAFTFRGWAYSFQGRVDDAIKQCKKAIAELERAVEMVPGEPTCLSMLMELRGSLN